MIVYVPGWEKLTVGLGELDNCPFPKSQTSDVGLFVERFVKVTVSGEQPDSLLAEKSATGACAKDFPEIVNRLINIAVK